MQNKIFLKTICAVSFLAVPALAQDDFSLDELNLDGISATVETPSGKSAPAGKTAPAGKATPAAADLSNVDMSQKKAVDFSPRSSLESLELTPMPGVFETNINGPQPMGESVSSADAPSEQLLGRLTPDVFQEMAELERDNAFLKLQIQKEQMKNDLENVKAQYRQSRLDEIAKREEVVRSRIQWWQEQEKLRKEAEAAQIEAEELANQKAENEALKEQLAKAQAKAEEQRKKLEEAKEGNNEGVVPDLPAAVEEDVTPIVKHDQYSLINVKGTRGNLVAKVKNMTTNKVSTVHIGDSLMGEVVTGITPESVIILRDNAEYVIFFEDPEEKEAEENAEEEE